MKGSNESWLYNKWLFYNSGICWPVFAHIYAAMKFHKVDDSTTVEKKQTNNTYAAIKIMIKIQAISIKVMMYRSYLKL